MISLFLIINSILGAGAVWPFDMLQDQYIENIKDLPYSSGTPDVKWNTSGHINAWVDITGFKEEIRENGTNYVYGNPADKAIVQYDVSVNDFTVKECPNRRCFVMENSIKKEIKVSQEGNEVVAHLYVKLKWLQIIDDGAIGIFIWHYELDTFEAKTLKPNIYPKIDINSNIYIVKYPNLDKVSIYPRLNLSNVYKITVDYDGNIITHTLKTGHVEKTSKGIYFSNTSPVNYWNISGKNISRFGDNIILNINTSKFDSSKLHIIGSNMYESVEFSNFNITSIDNNAKDVLFNPVLFAVMGSISVFSLGSYYLLKNSFFRRW